VARNVVWRSGTKRTEYEKLPLNAEQRQEADTAILALGNNPYPPGYKKLAGQDGVCRITICADYRVLYTVTDAEVILQSAGDRKEAYR
jgi:mRNA-degrading endonuclease RelE of RelBE toxin-antitoxin system